MDGSYVLTNEETKNYWFKCYTVSFQWVLQAQRKLDNRKQKDHRTENNEAESSVLVK